MRLEEKVMYPLHCSLGKFTERAAGQRSEKKKMFLQFALMVENRTNQIN